MPSIVTAYTKHFRDTDGFPACGAYRNYRNTYDSNKLPEAFGMYCSDVVQHVNCLRCQATLIYQSAKHEENRR